jgi:hypothetical protein
MLLVINNPHIDCIDKGRGIGKSKRQTRKGSTQEEGNGEKQKVGRLGESIETWKLTMYLRAPYGTKSDQRRLQEAEDAARKRQINEKRNQEPTQEAAQAAKEKEKNSETVRNKAMKRQKAGKDKNEMGDDGKFAAVTTTPKGNKKTGDKKKEKPKRIKKPKDSPVPQGRRKVPSAGDESGCKHHGLRDLDMCDKAWMAAYVKVGAWLHKKPCIDCASSQDESTKDTREKVLDASVLLQLKQQTVAYICNCGPVAHKMEEGEEGREEYECDMMLCLPCYSERESKMGTASGGKRKRKPKIRD